MMSSSEYMYLFLESKYSFTKYGSLCPNYQIFVSTVTAFDNERVSNNTCESVFQFLLRYDCIKCGKIRKT